MAKSVLSLYAKGTNAAKKTILARGLTSEDIDEKNAATLTLKYCRRLKPRIARRLGQSPLR